MPYFSVFARAIKLLCDFNIFEFHDDDQKFWIPFERCPVRVSDEHLAAVLREQRHALLVRCPGRFGARNTNSFSMSPKSLLGALNVMLPPLDRRGHMRPTTHHAPRRASDLFCIARPFVSAGLALVASFGFLHSSAAAEIDLIGTVRLNRRRPSRWFSRPADMAFSRADFASGTWSLPGIGLLNGKNEVSSAAYRVLGLACGDGKFAIIATGLSELEKTQESII